MAVRQYIGARYVPKFFDGPNNSSDWVENLNYEALTLVTYGNNVFCSKRSVPSTVGAPNANPTYWVNVGLNSGESSSIAELTQRVNEAFSNIGRIDGELDDLEASVTGDIEELRKLNLGNAKVAFFGDSITYGATVTGGVSGRAEKPFPEWFGEITGATVYNLGLSGAAMYDPGNLWSFYSHLTDYNFTEYDYAVLMFGINDVGNGAQPWGTTVNNGFGYAYDLAVSHIINANPTIHLILCTIPYTSLIDTPVGNYGITERFANDVIYKVAQKYNLSVIDVNKTLGVSALNLARVTGDGRHFNEAGYKMLGQFMSNMFPGIKPTGASSVSYAYVEMQAGQSGTATLIANSDCGWHSAIVGICSNAEPAFEVIMHELGGTVAGMRIVNTGTGSLVGGYGSIGGCNIEIDVDETNSHQIKLNCVNDNTARTLGIVALMF